MPKTRPALFVGGIGVKACRYLVNIAMPYRANSKHDEPFKQKPRRLRPALLDGATEVEASGYLVNHAVLYHA